MTHTDALSAAGFVESSPSFWTRGDSVIRINRDPSTPPRMRSDSPFSVFSTAPDSHAGALDCATVAQAIAVAAVLDSWDAITRQLAASALGALASTMGEECCPVASEAGYREIRDAARRLLSATLSDTLEP
jgi:hypothetical protein